MRLNPCCKCKIKPDVLRAAALTVVKCFKCGQAESAIFGSQKARRQWNEANPLEAARDNKEKADG